MQSQVNIVAVVDVIAALSDGTLGNGNLCLVDDSWYGSTGQGTTGLCTVCLPGQLITWTVLPVDVQTPVEIKAITFLRADGTADRGQEVCPPGESADLALDAWSGVVPVSLAGREPQRYRLELQMHGGGSGVLYVDSPALTCARPGNP